MSLCLLFVASVVAMILAYNRIGRIDCAGIKTGGDVISISQSASLLPATVPEVSPLLTITRKAKYEGVLKFTNDFPNYDYSKVLDEVGLGFYVLENNEVNWNQLEQANIFNNPEFNGEKLIAPGTSGSYYFTIKNASLFTIRSKLTIADINEWDIPMKFRLRTEREYIYGDEETWLDSDEFAKKVLTVSLGARSEQEYIIDWQWIFYENDLRDQADTFLGNASYFHYAEKIYNYDFDGDGTIGPIGDAEEEPEVTYTLLLSIYAEQALTYYCTCDFCIKNECTCTFGHSGDCDCPDCPDDNETKPIDTEKEVVTTGRDVTYILLAVMLGATCTMLVSIFAKPKRKGEADAQSA